MNRNRLYAVLGVACAAGYGWLFYAIATDLKHSDFTPCIIKSITGIACPSCGSTRALMMLLEGNVAASVMMNPIGLILAIIMVLVPVWLVADLALKKATMFEVYKKAERLIGTKWIAVILIGLVLANWAWNIYKDV